MSKSIKTAEIMTENVRKRILIKTPRVFIWTLIIVMILLGNSVSLWSEKMANTCFGIATGLYLGIAIYGFCLIYRFYSRKSLKQIVIHDDDDVVLIYQMLRSRTPVSYEYRARKQSIRIVIKGNKMNLLENGKSIASVYKGTLQDKNDWIWLISYFDE